MKNSEKGRQIDIYKMKSKQQIRVALKRKRALLPIRETKQLSAKICENLQNQPSFLQADAIYFYYPLGTEVNLLFLAEIALAMGKQIAFPKVNGTKMDFYQVNSLTEFTEGSFHVMEPTGQRKICKETPLVLVPGLAFDTQGRRMGYGKGYYDKYFARYLGCMKIGVCYEMQIIDEVPTGQYDIPMNMVATEQGIYLSRRS